jgi:hypothetical protein
LRGREINGGRELEAEYKDLDKVGKIEERCEEREVKKERLERENEREKVRK